MLCRQSAGRWFVTCDVTSHTPQYHVPSRLARVIRPQSTGVSVRALYGPIVAMAAESAAVRSSSIRSPNGVRQPTLSSHAGTDSQVPLRKTYVTLLAAASPPVLAQRWYSLNAGVSAMRRHQAWFDGVLDAHLVGTSQLAPTRLIRLSSITTLPAPQTPMCSCVKIHCGRGSGQSEPSGDLFPLHAPSVMRESVAASHPNPTPPPRQGRREGRVKVEAGRTRGGGSVITRTSGPDGFCRRRTWHRVWARKPYLLGKLLEATD